MYLDHVIDLALDRAIVVEPRRGSLFEPAPTDTPVLERESIAPPAERAQPPASTTPPIADTHPARREDRVTSRQEPAPPRGTSSSQEVLSAQTPLHPVSPMKGDGPTLREVTREVVIVDSGAPPSRPASSHLQPTSAAPMATPLSVVPVGSRPSPLKQEVRSDVETRREVMLTTEVRHEIVDHTDLRAEIVRLLAALPRPAVSAPRAATPVPDVRSEGRIGADGASRPVPVGAPGRSTSVSRRGEARPPASLEPHVQVTIGRVEIRATVPPSKASSEGRRTAGPRLRLDDYLRRREGS